MAFNKLNDRSIRLFVATKDELEKHRPNLNAPYFRVKRDKLLELLDLTDGDVVMSLGVWRRKGRDDKPDYFTAELTFPDAENQAKYIAKDDSWLAAHPRTAEDNERRKQFAINQRAAEKIGVSEADELPF